jgi:phage terminase large subunit-like protein
MKIQLPKVFQKIFEPKRYKVLSGGRGSGKSMSVAIYLLVRASQSKVRILCSRELMNSISDSVYKILCDLVEIYKMPFFEITQNSLRHTKTGSEFIFKGLRHNVMEIKSMQGIDIAWQEEAQALTKESLDILIPTIRNPNSELIFTFNRLELDDPVFELFCKNEDPEVWYCHSTYKDNKFFPNVLELERQRCLRENPQDYDHIWLGEPKTRGGNLFKVDFFKWSNCIPREQDYMYRFIMADTAYKDKQVNYKGKSTDPDYHVFTYCGVLDKKLYIIDIARKQLNASDVEDWITPWILPKVNYGFRYVWTEIKGHGIYINQKFRKDGKIPVPTDEMLQEFFKDRNIDKVERANNAIPFIDKINHNVIINTAMGDDKIKIIQSELSIFPNGKHDDVVETVWDSCKLALSKKDYVTEYRKLVYGY